MINKQYSLAAQAVSDAANPAYWDRCEITPVSAEIIVAAALRAADQIIEDVNPVEKLILIAQEIEETK